MRSAVLSVIAVGLALLTLGNSLSVAMTQNMLALCWTRESPLQHCRERLEELTQMAASHQQVRFVASRFWGLLKDDARVLELLESVDTERLDSLTAYHLTLAYMHTTQVQKATTLAEHFNFPTKLFIGWALDANNRGDKPAARAWLYAAERRQPKDWSARRWLGFLWWDVDRDRQKAIAYLEPVHTEAPEAVHPMLLLGAIYRDVSIDRSIELLERAYSLKPDDLTIIRNLLDSYTLRGGPEDLKKVARLRMQAISLLTDHLRVNPDDQSARRWLAQLQGGR